MASAFGIDFAGGLHHVISSGNTLIPNKPWQCEFGGQYTGLIAKNWRGVNGYTAHITPTTINRLEHQQGEPCIFQSHSI